MTIISIGRDPSNTIVLDNPHVSSFHAELSIDNNGVITLTDKSLNGTIVNQTKFHKKSTQISRGASVLFANTVPLDWNKVPTPQNTHGFKHVITIGTNPDNTITYYNNTVSRYHATIKIDKKGKIFINDQSLNGTQVNGNRIAKFTDFPITRKDRISFANEQVLDWTQIPKTGINPAYFIPAAIILLLFGAFYIIPPKFKNEIFEVFMPPNVATKYQNSVGLIYHSFYLAYIDNGDTLYYIGADNKVVDFKNHPEDLVTLKPLESTGSGFYVSDNGEIITNKHVACPWESGLAIDKDEIEKRINIVRAVINHEYSVKSNTVGITVKLGFFPNGSLLDKNDPYKNMLPCKLLNLASEKEVDLALIQLVSKKTPSESVPVTNIVSQDDDISLDDEVSIFGFPFGFDLALKNNESKVKATFDHGKVSKISDKYEIQYNAPSFHGASGSPVFNKEGKLIAVNYAGMEKAQGYNFGIIASHIHKLLNED